MNRKGERGPRRFKGSIPQRYGSFCLFFFFSLLLSTGAFFKFSPYNRALYTIKPSLTPPPRQLAVSDLETQVICHQRRGARGNSKPSMGAPHWALTALDAALQKKSLNIAKQSSRGRRGWRGGVSVLPTACQSFSLLAVFVCVRSGLHVLACVCFLSGRRPVGDKEKVKVERTADGVSSAYIV